MIELHLLRGSDIVFVVPVRKDGVRSGRAPDNTLVVNEPTVSSHHAVVTTDGTRTIVRDLGSRNGTFVNNERVQADHEITPSDSLRLGPDTVLAVAEREKVALPTSPPVLLVEDTQSNVAVPVTGDRFFIGSGSDAHLAIPDSPERLATLLVYEQGEVWLGTDDEERMLPLGEPFAIGDRTFTLRHGDALQAATAVPEPDPYRYPVSATLDGPTGAEAQVVDLVTGLTHAVTAENWAILLYLLARQFGQDREAEMPAAKAGWCEDVDVLTGIWGRDVLQENKLHVLLHRLRGEIKKAGLDPWFIEKRQRYVRARLAEAHLY